MDKTKLISKIFIVYSVVMITRLSAQIDCSKVDRLYIKDSAVPVKGHALQLNCNVNNFKDSSQIILTRNDLQTSEQITQCITSYCTNVPFKWRQSYTVSSDNNGVYLQIKSLNRSEDENIWICMNPCGESKSLQFTVHTVPQLLQFDNPPSQDEDLVRNAVTLKCRTGCTYPQPSVTWFYNETGDSRREWPNSGSVSHKAGGCTDSERIYTSTLSLPRYTTFPDNADKTVNFSCGITSFPGLTQSLYTGSYVNVRFAVRVTSITLKTGTSTPSDPLKVVSGTSTTLTCITSVSRPVATVVWYLGTEEKQRSNTGSSFTFIPHNNDHNKQIYCKAFNLQPEKDAVSSNKATLYVLEPTLVKFFYIGERDGQANFTADEHDDIQFNCEIGGDPASNVKIIFEGEILAEQVDTNKLTFIRQDVDCLHNGVYFCEGNDSYGLTSSKNVTLLVKCSPRPRRQILRNITSPLYVPVTLTLNAIAYPEPGPKGFSWYKENKKGWIPLLSNEDLHVSSSGLQTSLTIMNVSRAHFGQYRVTVENSIGTYDQYLFLSGEGLTVLGTETSKDDKECTTSIVIAVTFGIICGVLAGYATGITILHRRKMIRKGTKFPDKTKAETTYVNSAYKSDVPKVPETVRRRENIDDANGINEDSLKQYTDLAQYSRDDITTYDVIQKT
ncbi:uncharacterized protein LOC123561312 isoform X1 [Mercenaria mercenaria]|uniref:uncharacterized protein LOC123561312 isoform X1 n=1 Tax=Mercenaria mercenaria TaxID=6596 RepID=UPI00234F3C30|nr:uncharacterized protein LOC123561312 isoform X1 [Mercenaria mercenaria]